MSKKVTPEALQLMRLDGFIAAFYKNCATAATDKEAYELTEMQYKEFFGNTRYSSYDSFRTVKNRKLNNK